MKYSDYKEAITNIVTSNDIEGPAIETIISSLTYSLYNNDINNINLLKESNLLTSNSLNSLISHASSRGYSVDRGQNIIYQISGINPVQDVSVNKFDLFFSLDGYELRYTQDYELIRDNTPNPTGITIELVLCEKNGFKGQTRRSNQYSSFISQSNVSQSLAIYDINGDEYSLHNSYEEYLKDRYGEDSKNWVYGQDKYKHVKIYHPLENVVNDSIKGLVELKTYPRGGDGFTPGSTSSNLNQRSGGSFRVVINTKDWDKSFATNSPGQSGDPNSKFYKNLYEDWANDKFFPLLFSKSKVLRNLSDRKVYRPID